MIHSRIKKIRESFGISRKIFAEKLDLPLSNLSYLESGEREPSRQVLTKMAETFNININWLLLGQGEMFVDGDFNSEKTKKIEELEQKIEFLTKQKEELDKINSSLENQLGEIKEENVKTSQEIKERLMEIVSLQRELLSLKGV